MVGGICDEDARIEDHRLVAPLGHEPRQQARGNERFVIPNPVIPCCVAGVNYPSARKADTADGIVVVADGHRIIVGGVEAPDGNVGDPSVVSWAAAGHRNCGGKEKGITVDYAPNSKCAHGNAGDVDPVGIDGVLGGQRLNGTDDLVHGIGAPG